jgi:hypothetical protein
MLSHPKPISTLLVKGGRKEGRKLVKWAKPKPTNKTKSPTRNRTNMLA